MIEPTVGRIVWFHPVKDVPMADDGQPLAGIIARVWTPHLINLTYFDCHGGVHAEKSVMLLQDDDLPIEGQAYAEWMPYQKGQAAKYEALVPGKQDGAEPHHL